MTEHFWPIGPRKRPYTNDAIKKLPCVRCGDPGFMTFQLCADNRQYRILCKACSTELTNTLLEWPQDRKPSTCAKCDNPGDNIWDSANGPLLLCDTCDVILNKLVLSWAKHPYAEMLGNTYEHKTIGKS